MQLSTGEMQCPFQAMYFPLCQSLCQRNSKHSEHKLERMKIMEINGEEKVNTPYFREIVSGN